MFLYPVREPTVNDQRELISLGRKFIDSAKSQAVGLRPKYARLRTWRHAVWRNVLFFTERYKPNGLQSQKSDYTVGYFKITIKLLPPIYCIDPFFLQIPAFFNCNEHLAKVLFCISIIHRCLKATAVKMQSYCNHYRQLKLTEKKDEFSPKT